MIACFVTEMMGIGCERARLPHLWGEPFGLAENNQLVAVSPESYPYGVRAGQGVTFARTLCQGLIVLPYDREAYLKAAEAVWDVIAVETSFVEPLSPEVVFADFCGPEIPRRAKSIAAHLSNAIGLCVRVGLGTSKLVAQQAALRSDGSRIVIAPGKEAALLALVPLSSLAAIPAKTKAKADKLGLRTLGDVLTTPRSELERQFKNGALQLLRLAGGEDGSSVRPLWPPAAISRALVFDDEVSDERFIDHALMTCGMRISKVLTRDEKFCRIAALSLELSDRTSVSEQEELKEPIRDPAALQRAGQRLYQRMTLTAPVLRLELTVSALTIGGAVQLTLLDEESSLTFEQRKSLDASLDHLREKFGIRAIISAKLLHKSQRIHLWTYPLGQSASESVEVVTAPTGDPLRIYRTNARSHHVDEFIVTRVQNSWRESDWSWGSLSEKMCYRVFTHPDGLYELQRLDDRWRLCALAD